MFTGNPFADLSTSVPPVFMRAFVIVMALLVVVGTLFDIIHKQSARYFFPAHPRDRHGMPNPIVARGNKVTFAEAMIAGYMLGMAAFACLCIVVYVRG